MVAAKKTQNFRQQGHFKQGQYSCLIGVALGATALHVVAEQRGPVGQQQILGLRLTAQSYRETGLGDTQNEFAVTKIKIKLDLTLRVRTYSWVNIIIKVSL